MKLERAEISELTYLSIACLVGVCVVKAAYVFLPNSYLHVADALYSTGATFAFFAGITMVAYFPVKRAEQRKLRTTFESDWSPLPQSKI